MTLRATRQYVEALGPGDGKARVSRQYVDVLGSGNGAARVSRQYVDVLGSGNGAARVSRQYVEVLIAAPLDDDVFQIVTLVQTADGLNIPMGSASQTLVVSQTIVHTLTHPYFRVYYQSATTPLVITQEARGGIFRLSCHDTLTLVDGTGYIGPRWLQAASMLEPVGGYGNIAYVGQTYDETSFNSLVFVQTARQSVHNLAANDTVVFNTEADNTVKYRHVTDTLVITQAATWEKIYTALSHLALTQLGEQGVLRLSCSSQIIVTNTARNSCRVVRANSTDLILSQLARSSDTTLHANDSFALNQNVDVRRPYHVAALSPLGYIEMVYDQDLNDYVPYVRGLSQSVALIADVGRQASNTLFWAISSTVSHVKVVGTDVDAASVLSISQELFKNVTGSAVNVLVPISTAAGYLSNYVLSDPLVLTSTASFNIDRVLQALDQLDIVASMGYVTSENFRCEYHPWVGGGNNLGMGWPSVTPPMMPGGPYPTADGAGRGVVFFYPFSGTATYTWTTPHSPSFGNKVQFMAQRINRETRGGRKIVYADLAWPTEFRRVFSFNGLTETECTTWLTFIQNTLGKEIGYTDNDGRIFKGVLSNIQDPVTRNGKLDNAISVNFIITASSYPLAAGNSLIPVETCESETV